MLVGMVEGVRGAVAAAVAAGNPSPVSALIPLSEETPCPGGVGDVIASQDFACPLLPHSHQDQQRHPLPPLLLLPLT